MYIYVKRYESEKKITNLILIRLIIPVGIEKDDVVVINIS